MLDMNELIDRIMSSLVAFAAGDAMGWSHSPDSGNISNLPKDRFSLMPWQRIFGDVSDGIIESVDAGAYGNLTYFMLGACRNVINGGSPEDYIATEIAAWSSYKRYPYPYMEHIASRRFRPGLTKKNIKLWKEASDGAAVVRSIPLAIRAYIEDKSPEDLMETVARDCMSTHGHPTVVLASQIYAYMLLIGLKNDNYGLDDAYEDLLSHSDVWGRFFEGACPDGVFASEEDLVDYAHDFDAAKGKVLLLLNRIGAPSRWRASYNDLIRITGCDNQPERAIVNVLCACYIAMCRRSSPEIGIMTIPLSPLEHINRSEIAALTGGLMGMFGDIELQDMHWNDVQDLSFIEKVSCIIASSDMKDRLDEILEVEGDPSTELKESPVAPLHPVPQGECGQNLMIDIRRSSLGQTFHYAAPQRLLPEKNMIIRLRSGWKEAMINALGERKCADVFKALILFGTGYSPKTLFPDEKTDLPKILTALEDVFRKQGFGWIYADEKKLYEDGHLGSGASDMELYDFSARELFELSYGKTCRTATLSDMLSVSDISSGRMGIGSVFKAFEPDMTVSPRRSASVETEEKKDTSDADCQQLELFDMDSEDMNQ